MFGFTRKPFAQLTVTTHYGTFRWTQGYPDGLFIAEMKVGRGWKREYRLDAPNPEGVGFHLRDLMS